MDILKIAGIILAAVILVSSLPTFDKSISAIISVATCVLVLVYIVNMISPAVETIQDLFINETDNDFSIIFKTMGISLITQFVADVATDSGNKALANQMVFTGKTAIVILALPVFVQVLEIIGQLIK